MRRSETTVGLLGVGAYTPERVMTNDDWARHVDTSDAWIRERTGIARRHFAADDESTVDLALGAARSALADAGLGAADLDEIIVATDTPEVRSPDTAAYLQHGLGARQIPAYDLCGSGCAGFVQALDVARSRVRCEPSRRILVVGVELISRMMDWNDRATCVLFGDAAGAMVVGATTSGSEILGVVTGTDGSRTDILGWHIGGTRQPATVELVAANRHRHVTMHGREVFREAVRRMSAASLQVLDASRLTIDDLSLVVAHQANRRILDAVARSLGVPAEKLYVNIEEYGNTGSASVPLALAEAREQGRVAPGDVVLLTTFGAGFHWAAALVRM